MTDPAKFWLIHNEEEGYNIFSLEFKDLFMKMVSFDPRLRPSIDDVRCHPFMLGRYPHRHDVYEEFRHRKVLVVGAKKL